MSEQPGPSLRQRPPILRDSQAMKRIAQLRERFLAGDEIEPGAVSPVILDSWIRSRAAGVDPKLSRAPCDRRLPVAGTIAPWASTAGTSNVLSFLADVFSESPYIITLVDASCRVLAVRGAANVLERAESIGVVPGANWSEAATGCNSLATSICTGRPVCVSWQENYIAVARDWAGAAAAIHHPTTGEILGCIGINGCSTLNHPKIVELCIDAVNMVQAAISARAALLRSAVLERYSELLGRYPGDGIVAVDEAGRIVALSSNMEKTAGAPAAQLIGRLLHETPLSQRLELSQRTSDPGVLLDRIGVEGCELFPVNSEEDLGLVMLLSSGSMGRGKEAPRAKPACNPAAPSRSRRDVLEGTESELILAALRSAYNVTEAAARLGVHHATLYRRMKKLGIVLPRRRKGEA